MIKIFHRFLYFEEKLDLCSRFWNSLRLISCWIRPKVSAKFFVHFVFPLKKTRRQSVHFDERPLAKKQAVKKKKNRASWDGDYIQLFRERLSKRSIEVYATIPKGIMVNCQYESTKTWRQCYRKRQLEIHAHALLLTSRYKWVSKFSQMIQTMN